MKLYPILFTNEAAKTATEALSSGIAAVKTTGEYNPTVKRIILVDVAKFKNNVVDYLKKFMETYEDSSEDEASVRRIGKSSLQSKLSDNDEAEISVKLLESVIGQITYEQSDNGDDLYKIGTSSAIKDFGPLAYQMVMYDIDGSWLCSDYSLKPASAYVWQKMFEYSNPGANQLYQRAFTTEWPGEFEARTHLVRNHRLEAMLETSTIESERDFLHVLEYAFEEGFIEEEAADPKLYGFLWAYKKVSHDPKIAEMFNLGDELRQDLSKAIGFEQGGDKYIAKQLNSLAKRFFFEYYGSDASYR